MEIPAGYDAAQIAHVAAEACDIGGKLKKVALRRILRVVTLVVEQHLAHGRGIPRACLLLDEQRGGRRNVEDSVLAKRVLEGLTQGVGDLIADAQRAAN